jgi:hypothetical protein
LRIVLALCAVAAVTLTGGGCLSEKDCARSLPGVEPSRAAPGETFRFFGGRLTGAPCGPPASHVRVELRQGDRAWNLGTLRAGPSPRYRVDARLTVPNGAEPGPATVVVRAGEGPPMEVPFRVLDGETATSSRAAAASGILVYTLPS